MDPGRRVELLRQAVSDLEKDGLNEYALIDLEFGRGEKTSAISGPNPSHVCFALGRADRDCEIDPQQVKIGRCANITFVYLVGNWGVGRP